MPKAPTLLASVLVGALLLGTGTGRADESPADQAVLDCVRDVPGHDYIGGDFQRHAAAVGVWSECMVGARLKVQDALGDKLEDATPGSDNEKALKVLRKKLNRDTRKLGLVADAARALDLPGTPKRTAKLLKRMHTGTYLTAASTLESYQQAYSHAAQSSALFRLQVEQQLDDRHEALLGVTAQSAARFRKKGAKFVLLAVVIGAELDSIEADVLSAMFTVREFRLRELDEEEARSAIRVERTLHKQIRRYHAGIRVLVKIERKLQDLVEKAQRAADRHPDPDPDADPEPDPDPDPVTVDVSEAEPIAAIPSTQTVREQVTISVTLDLLPADEWFQPVVDFGDDGRVVFGPMQGGEFVRVASVHRYFGVGTHEATVEIRWLKGFASGVFGISEPVEVFRDTVTVEIVQ